MPHSAGARLEPYEIAIGTATVLSLRDTEVKGVVAANDRASCSRCEETPMKRLIAEQRDDFGKSFISSCRLVRSLAPTAVAMRKLIVFLALAEACAAQPVFTNVFPPDEYAARRARVMDKIADGVAILQGTTERPGEQPLRQSNQFFYVSGVVEPRAILVIDGKTHSSTLFLNPRDPRREQSVFGPGLYPGQEAGKATGI